MSALRCCTLQREPRCYGPRMAMRRRRGGVPCAFVPPHIIDRLARAGALTSVEPSAAAVTAVVGRQLRRARERGPGADALPELGGLAGAVESTAERRVYDAGNGFTFERLLVRAEGDPPAAAENVNLAYDHAGAARDYWADVHDRDSVDGAGMDLLVNVNFGVDFLNAFWDGTRIVLGNGDGEVFVDFARSPDVMGHELTHGVVEFTADLEYVSQSGALNESFADVFGSLIEQRLRGQDFATGSWLIGEEIMAPALQGQALRSLAAPGTAYDDPVLGTDPQPAHMDDYYDGPDDNEGVHINSGIPNHAFYLAAAELDTAAAGAIWYAGLRQLWPTAGFSDAAAVLAAQAGLLAEQGTVPAAAEQVVADAFSAVGVEA